MLLSTWQTLNKNKSDFIVQASVQDGSDSWTDFPIGMGYHWYNNKNTNLIGNHNDTVLCAINTNTDIHRPRNGITCKIIVENLKKNGIENKLISPDIYFSTLSNYKFIISPEGNGIDCHRHYEALMYGCIPIIERNPLTEKKYKNLPVLWTTDYSEITEEYLNNVYEDFLKKEYDFSSLFLSSYQFQIQKQIREKTNFWIKIYTGKQYYNNKLLPFLKI